MSVEDSIDIDSPIDFALARILIEQKGKEISRMNNWMIEICESDLEWDELVEDSEQNSVFCSSSFLNEVAPSHKKVGLYDKNKIIAGAVIYENHNSQKNDIT